MKAAIAAIFILLSPAVALAGAVYLVYPASMTQETLDSLSSFGYSYNSDSSKVTTLLRAANTNYFVLEVDSMAVASSQFLKDLISAGEMAHVGDRWTESYFDSRTGQQVTITRTSEEKDQPKEYKTTFYVDRSSK